MALEREIKLRFDSAAAARALVVTVGGAPLRPRRLQVDVFLDTADGALGRRRSALRLRREDGAAFLTFKGPPYPGAMKLREEHETAVADAEAAVKLLQALGFDERFRYEKHREEFTLAGVTLTIDETPAGVFVELEGDEARIHQVAGALGRSPADYITESYRTLFDKHRATAPAIETAPPAPDPPDA